MPRIYRPSRKRKLSSRPEPKHRALRRQAPAFSWLYDGRDLVAVLERRSDGWRVLMRGRDDIGRTFETREEAVAAAHDAASTSPSWGAA